MSKSQITFQEHIPKEREGTYFEREFPVPEHVCRIDVSYAYKRYAETDQAGVRTRREINTIDLALRDGTGNYIGASGAGRSSIYISAGESSAGYASVETAPGQWAVIIGAYHIAPEGVDVTYTVTFTYRQRIRLQGDPHVHTLASDGQMSAKQLTEMAGVLGLDFLFLTDHNNYAHNFENTGNGPVHLFPGSEWTHYQGHAGMLGIQRPIRSPFCVNSSAEAWKKLSEAQENGALVSINHPFCPNCGWRFGLDGGSFDLVEVWNGGTDVLANQTCLTWWHQELCRGRRLAVIGGSDFHRVQPGAGLGQPTTAVYAMSPSLSDVRTALRQGNSYIKAWPKGPDLWAECVGAILGETAPAGDVLSLRLTSLSGGETLRIVTNTDCEEFTCPPSAWELSLSRTYPQAAFVRFELYRHSTLLLLSNPIYFSKNER